MAGILTLSSKISPFPYAAIGIASYTQKATLDFDETVSSITLDLDGTKLTSEDDIVHALAKAGELSADNVKAPSFFALAKTLPHVSSLPEIIVALDSLDDHLTFRTYLIGHEITAADWILWGSLKGNGKTVGLLKNNKHPHLQRWFSHIESLETTQAALLRLTEAKSSKARNNKTAASFALGLQNAEEGKVVTRFPPEPSGYLHIGHAKAALLNQYFAKMYKGKLIIRFDDTNPSKEKSEFEETILEDLRLLGIQGDQVTHTSDYFEHLYNLAVQIIKAGKAYADDTEQLQMRDERMKGIASKHRDDSVEDNLKRFAEMKAGTEEGLRWCIRAKMSVDNPNKAMRDPVIYRCNVTEHHRTGGTWKVYPTYDFACPVVDSLEGVTHALRTNEYRDRNPQYQWMIEALEIRPVNIWDFSRLSFIYTLLSKRKLHWFVDQKLVHGWDDPRFPTVRGIRRRGLTVEAITQFMLAQGPSQAVVSLEWDSIWTLNKKIIDPIAPRFWAILKDKQVPVTITGGPAGIEVKNLPKHKKNPEVGEKKTVYSSNIVIDQEDALSFEDQEEITLMDWGNAIVTKKTTDASGTITALEMKLHLEGDFRKTKKKITWLSQSTTEHPLVDVTLLDYDYLITKKKLEEGDDVADFVPEVSEFKEAAVADANVHDLKKGDIMQFERKGYFIFDGTAADGKLEFILIPDGRAGSVASKAGVAAAAKPAIATPAASSGPDIQVDTKMYNVEPVYGAGLKPVADTKMYKVDNLYDA
ncbi:hypothetical protein HWV62_24776 [Athelia sp. TMB]|nr:hypothetical protein HWV62_24776 [Athelia sp. TMB]